MWSEDCKESFNILKTALVQTPVLAFSSQNDHLVLDTDACNYGMGAVLSQIQDDSKKVVCFLANRSVALNEIIVLQEDNFSLL